ncbi:MAG: RHS repeat-associated core domain-containing protein, partial [Eubacteriales bacterium]
TRPESQDPLYYLHDGLGSVTQLVRPNGEVRDHYGYDEYGVPAPGAKLSEDGRNVNHNTFGYTGELWDEEDNLLYLRSRYYMPEVGRFINRDTFPGYTANPLSMHKYAYVENNSVNFVDPSGNWAAKAHEELTRDVIDSFINNYEDTSFGKFLSENEDFIIEHSNDPDGYIRNTFGGYQWADHFFNPDTGKNYKGNKELIAPQRVKEFMGNAKCNYKVDKIEAARAIAWALHFLEDMSNPYHTSDKVGGPLGNSNHSAYEDWADRNVSNKVVSVVRESVPYADISKQLALESHHRAESQWQKGRANGLYYLPYNDSDLGFYFDQARKYGTQLLYTFYDAVK